MRIFILLGTLTALTGCVTTAQVNSFCERAPKARADAAVIYNSTVANADLLCAASEKQCVLADKIKATALLTYNTSIANLDALCPVVVQE